MLGCPYRMMLQWSALDLGYFGNQRIGKPQVLWGACEVWVVVVGPGQVRAKESIDGQEWRPFWEWARFGRQWGKIGSVWGRSWLPPDGLWQFWTVSSGQPWWPGRAGQTKLIGMNEYPCVRGQSTSIRQFCSPLFITFHPYLTTLRPKHWLVLIYRYRIFHYGNVHNRIVKRASIT